MPEYGIGEKPEFEEDKLPVLPHTLAEYLLQQSLQESDRRAAAVEDAILETPALLHEQTQKMSDYTAAQAAKQDQDEAQRFLDRKQQWHHDRRIALMSALITIFLTLLVEHAGAVISFLRSLFQ